MFNLVRVVSRTYERDKRARNFIPLDKSASQESEKPKIEPMQAPYRILKSKPSRRYNLARSYSDWSVCTECSYEGDTLEEMNNPDPKRKETELFAKELEECEKYCDCDECINIRINSTTEHFAAGFRAYVRELDDQVRIQPHAAPKFIHYQEVYKVKNGKPVGKPIRRNAVRQSKDTVYTGRQCNPTRWPTSADPVHEVPLPFEPEPERELRDACAPRVKHSNTYRVKLAIIRTVIPKNKPQPETPRPVNYVEPPIKTTEPTRPGVPIRRYSVLPTFSASHYVDNKGRRRAASDPTPFVPPIIDSSHLPEVTGKYSTYKKRDPNYKPRIAEETYYQKNRAWEAGLRDVYDTWTFNSPGVF